MKLATVFLLVGLVNGQGSIYGTSTCWPATCKNYGDCYDSIHGYQGLCCGGKCTDLYTVAYLNPVFVGGSCTDTLSLLMGTTTSCSFCDDYSSYCSSGKCVAKMPNGCSCTTSTATNCISHTCGTSTTGTSVCIGTSTNLPVGATCYANTECATDVCTSNKCAGIAQGNTCVSYYSDYCAAGLTCLENLTYYTYSCQPPCAAGVAQCCSYDADCATGNYCYYYNHTCLPQLAAGADCTYYASGSCGPGLACACSGASCATRTCVTAHSVADGTQCTSTSSLECHATSWCAPVNASSYTYVCVGNGTIASGSPCAYYLPGLVPTGAQCAAPANACSDVTGNGQATCHVGGSVALGGGCDSTYSKGDCASGNICGENASYAYVCQAPVPVGGNCTSATYGGVPCASGSICYNTASVSTSSCYSFSYGCTCNAFVADGSSCTASLQCKPTSKCGTSGTCVAVEGAACTTQSDCGATFSGWDCNCSKKCHLTVSAPTPYTYTDPCATQLAAANAVAPGFQSAGSIYGQTYSSNWAVYAGPYLGNLSDTNAVNKILQYICCETCVTGVPRFQAIPGGWQADCSTYTIKPVASSCAATKGDVALLNCFKSGAKQIAMSFGAIAAAVVAALF